VLGEKNLDMEYYRCFTGSFTIALNIQQFNIFLSDTGVRSSELLYLNIKEIDFSLDSILDYDKCSYQDQWKITTYLFIPFLKEN
jgi:hypothetical protein